FDPAVAVKHVAATDVSTAKADEVLVAALVQKRWHRRGPAEIVIVTNIHVLVIAVIKARQLIIRVEVFFAEQIGIAGAVGDVGNAGLATLVDHAGPFAVIRSHGPELGIVAGLQVRGTGPVLVRGILIGYRVPLGIQ